MPRHAWCTLLLVAEVGRACEAVPVSAYGSGDETLLLQVSLQPDGEAHPHPHQHSHDPSDAALISDLERLRLEEQARPQKQVLPSLPWLYYSPRWQERPRLQDPAEMSAARNSAASGEQNTQDWTILATTRNVADPGRLFFMERSLAAPGWLYLKTWFARYISLPTSRNRSVDGGHKYHWEGALLRLERHPFVPGMYCLKFKLGHCVGTAGLHSQPVVSQMPSAEHAQDTAVSITSWYDAKTSANLWKISFASGQVLSAMPSPQARASHQRGFGRAGLASFSVISCSVVGGGLVFLFVYNLSVALIGKSTPRENRLPHFDIMRFLLEVLVVHGHLGYFLGLLQVPWLPEFFASFRMPTFMIIAGIFGGNTSYESWSRSLCCTLGTYCLTVALSCAQFTPKYFWIGVGVQWFLVALAANRTFISPLFSRARRISEARESCRPVFGAFVCVKVASYLLMHAAKIWGWDSGYVGYLILQFLAFVPFFAFGLLLTPTEWDALLRQRWMRKASIIYFTAWYLLMLCPSFLQWNASYCMPHFQWRGCISHYDPEQVYGPVNILSFLLDVVMFGFRVGISVSFMSGVALACDLVAPVLPTFIELLAGWGSRTLYTYILHGYGFALLNQNGVLLLTDVFSAPVIKWVTDVMGPLFLNAVLSSQGSEHWLKWLVMPFWIKDLCEGIVAKFKV